jgi:hypothetical protein
VITKRAAASRWGGSFVAVIKAFPGEWQVMIGNILAALEAGT